MSAVDPAAAVTNSSRKGFWSSNNNPSVNPAGAVVATDPNGGRLQATKASLRKLNFFRRNKAGRQSIGDYNQGSSLVENRHITISHPIPAFENSPGSLQHGDALEELHEDLTTTSQAFDAPPLLGAIPTKTIPLTWEPLPLFKVYSRSIKYSTLPAPCLSAETILRNNAQRPRAGSLGEATCATTESHDEESTKNKKGKRKSLRSMDSLNKAGWTRKIYILETEGHMLQYGIEGPFDRLPEKIMKLGPNTAAFASDAIPGKHWVIQISNRVDDDVSKNTADPKKHFFTRLAHDNKREEQKSILMVLNGPEEMESWLASVRKEIQKHGGKEYISEDINRQRHTSAVPSREGVEGPLSRRTTAIADDNTLFPSRNPSSKRNSGNMAETLVQNRRSLPPRESVDAPSLATNGTDGDRLHDKSRFSYASMGTRSASSASTSPCPSPGIAGDDQERIECPLSEFQIAYNRLSNYTSSETDPLQELSRRQTGSPPPAAPAPSRKPTPNFSMPIFSKRYSSQTQRTSMMPRSISSSSQSFNGGIVAHQNQEQRKDMLLKDPTAQPTRQRAVSTSVTESRPDAPQLLHPSGFKEHHTPKRYSSGPNDGRNIIKNNGRYSLDCRERKSSAPEVNSSQGYKLYNKPHPHIPETLDEDPMHRPKAANQESWPIPNNEFLGIHSSPKANRSSWGSNTSGHGHIDAIINSGADRNNLLTSPRSSSDIFKRASWGAPESPRSDAFEYNIRTPSPHSIRGQRASWGHTNGSASTNLSTPASPLSRRSSSRFSNHINPSDVSTPASNAYSAGSIHACHLEDGLSSVGFATSNIARSKSTHFVDLGPPLAPPPDCPLPDVPPNMQHISTLPPAPPPSGPLPEAPASIPFGYESDYPRLRGSSSRNTLNYDGRRRSGRSTYSRSSRNLAELARERRTTAVQEAQAVPLVLPPGRVEKNTQSDDVRAKKASMINAF